ncbi:MAG: nucleotidyltransferase domain-containing protein [Bacilli bacterium]|nr:nucleotidyltransferase domain-containing protein [Bacilli bacterium]MBR2892202.1 nucleotidyltransferase domain-containing protein [Bacilli bacterium]
MNKNNLNLIPNIAYPYKIIYSFFANYYDKYEYNKIKNAVLKINDWNNEYFNFYLIYSIVFAFDYKQNFEKYIPYYEMVFQNKFHYETKIEVDKILTNKDKKHVISKMFLLIKTLSIEEGFLLYLYMQKEINMLYDSLIVIPCDLFQNIKSIKNEYILTYYLHSVFLTKMIPNNEQLLSHIKEYYYVNKNKLINKYNIKNIYIFGSIMCQEYHRESDIDMVVEFLDHQKYSKVSEVFNELIKINKKTFDRNSDIHEYNDFVTYNSHISLLNLFDK